MCSRGYYWTLQRFRHTRLGTVGSQSVIEKEGEEEQGRDRRMKVQKERLHNGKKRALK